MYTIHTYIYICILYIHKTFIIHVLGIYINIYIYMYNVYIYVYYIYIYIFNIYVICILYICIYM